MITKFLYKESYAFTQNRNSELRQKREIIDNLALRYDVSIHSLEHPVFYSLMYGIVSIGMLLAGIFILITIFLLNRIDFIQTLVMVGLSLFFLILSALMVQPISKLHRYKIGFILDQYENLIRQGEITEAKILSNFYDSPMKQRIVYEMVTPKGEIVKTDYFTQSLETRNIKINDTVYLLYLNSKINTLL